MIANIIAYEIDHQIHPAGDTARNLFCAFDLLYDLARPLSISGRRLLLLNIKIVQMSNDILKVDDDDIYTFVIWHRILIIIIKSLLKRHPPSDDVNIYCFNDRTSACPIQVKWWISITKLISYCLFKCRRRKITCVPVRRTWIPCLVEKTSVVFN